MSHRHIQPKLHITCVHPGLEPRCGSVKVSNAQDAVYEGLQQRLLQCYRAMVSLYVALKMMEWLTRF